MYCIGWMMYISSISIYFNVVQDVRIDLILCIDVSEGFLESKSTTCLKSEINELGMKFTNISRVHANHLLFFSLETSTNLPPIFMAR